MVVVGKEEVGGWKPGGCRRKRRMRGRWNRRRGRGGMVGREGRR